MMDYEYLFSMNLHQKLRERVIGKVYCKVNEENELYIKIESFGNLKFSMAIDNFSERILNGYSTEYAVYEIMSKYEKFVHNRYFIKYSGETQR